MRSPPSPSSSSSSYSCDSSPLSTAPTTAPSSPKLSASDLPGLPSPFYPPTLAAAEGVAPSQQPDQLPPAFPPLPSTSQRPKEADAVTKGTPDEWIPRDERLVRLTGPSTCTQLMRREREMLTARAFTTASLRLYRQMAIQQRSAAAGSLARGLPHPNPVRRSLSSGAKTN